MAGEHDPILLNGARTLKKEIYQKTLVQVRRRVTLRDASEYMFPKLIILIMARVIPVAHLAMECKMSIQRNKSDVGKETAMKNRLCDMVDILGTKFLRKLDYKTHYKSQMMN